MPADVIDVEPLEREDSVGPGFAMPGLFNEMRSTRSIRVQLPNDGPTVVVEQKSVNADAETEIRVDGPCEPGSPEYNAVLQIISKII